MPRGLQNPGRLEVVTIPCVLVKLPTLFRVTSRMVTPLAVAVLTGLVTIRAP